MLIAVLGSAANWHLDDLRRAAAAEHEIIPVSYGQLCSQVADGSISVTSGDRDLSACDAVLVRTMPLGSLEQVVFRMDTLSQLAAAGVRVVNSPRSVEVAIDKYLATTRLQQAGLLVPPTATCQTASQALDAFEQLGGDVVVKPIFGGEGRGICRVSDAVAADRTFHDWEQAGSAIYLQQFIPHKGCDYRLLVIGKRILGMRRRNPHDWRTNISRGAVAEPLDVSPDLAELANQATRAVGAEIAGVDLLPGKDGKLYALEVNAVPGWRAISQVTKVDVAKLVLEFLATEEAAH